MTTTAPAVSVIVPTRNRRALLSDALASVVAQDFAGPVELIVVVDACDDGSATMVRARYPQARVIDLDRRAGRAGARNHGLAVARGKYVAFLDDDDLWAPTYLRTQLDCLGDRPRCYAVCALTVRDEVRGTSRLWLQRPDLARFSSIAHQLLVDNFIYTLSALIFRSDDLRELGGFDPEQEFGCDADLLLRCLLAGIAPSYTDQPLVTWRLHGFGQSNDRSNLRRRLEQSRRRARTYHPVLSAGFGVPSLARLDCEMTARLATLFLSRRDVWHWIYYCGRCAAMGAPGLALTTIGRDLGRSVRRRTLADVEPELSAESRDEDAPPRRIAL